MAKIVEVRNSTAEFLTFVAANKEDGVQVAMGELFGCSSDNIGVHLKNIYTEGELLEAATTEKISVVQLEGSRNVMASQVTEEDVLNYLFQHAVDKCFLLMQAI